MSIYDPATGSHTPTDEATPPSAAEASPSQDADNTGAPLAGLLTGRVLTRKRAYLAYASAALLVSFAPDVVTAGVLTGHQASVLTMWAALSASILLKAGTAFGFVAAANTGR